MGGVGDLIHHPHSSLIFFTIYFLHLPSVTDVNGDGYMDLVCKDSGRFGTTKVQLNKPGEYFVDDPEYNLEFPFCFNSKKNNFFLGDFNGDKNADLMCQAKTGRRQINVSHCH